MAQDSPKIAQDDLKRLETEPKRQRQTSHTVELRRMRENVRRKPKASGDPTVARRQLEELASSAYGKAKAKLCGMVKQDRKRSRAAAAENEQKPPPAPRVPIISMAPAAILRLVAAATHAAIVAAVQSHFSTHRLITDVRGI